MDETPDQASPSYYDDEMIWQDLGADESMPPINEVLTAPEPMFPDAEGSTPARFEEDGTITPPRFACDPLQAYLPLEPIVRVSE